MAGQAKHPKVKNLRTYLTLSRPGMGTSGGRPLEVHQEALRTGRRIAKLTARRRLRFGLGQVSHL